MNGQQKGDQQGQEKSALSLTADGEALYRRILRTGPVTLDRHAAELGWDTVRAKETLDHLTKLRLVRRSPDDLLRADDPRAGLGRLLDKEERELDEKRRELLSLREGVASFETDYRRGLALAGAPNVLVEEVPRIEVTSVAEHLHRSTDGSLLQIRQYVPDDVIGEREMSGRRTVSLHGREQRAIFSFGVLSEMRWESIVRERQESGEVQRYIDPVPGVFILFGNTAVLMKEHLHAEADFLLIRHSGVLNHFRALFELMWAQAAPVHDAVTNNQDRRILELLALGFKDEAIARYASASVRTVRRRIALLMERYGADTRFQLGLAVERHNLLSDESGRSSR